MRSGDHEEREGLGLPMSVAFTRRRLAALGFGAVLTAGFVSVAQSTEAATGAVQILYDDTANMPQTFLNVAGCHNIEPTLSEENTGSVLNSTNERLSLYRNADCEIDDFFPIVFVEPGEQWNVTTNTYRSFELSPVPSNSGG